MKIFTSLLVAASLFCLAACTENKQTSSETQTATAESLLTPVTANAGPTATSATITNLDDKILQATMEIDEAPTAAPVTTAPGTNPPHGLPGHDCSLAVGAPLNSKNNAAPASQPNAAPQNASPMNGPVLTVPALPSTPRGINPPHGQPGHDCSVAVGAPLRK